jgi:hypothetical protein
MHNLQSFREILRVAVETVRQDVWTGWSMFHQFETDGIAPYIQIDETTGCEVEVLETNHLGKTKFSTTLPDFWRVALDGRATIIRPYREDRRNDRALRPGFEAGTWLSPDLFIRDIYEFVTFARHLVKSFHGAGIVEFLCTWWGLEARRIADPDKDWRPGVSRVDSRSASAIVQPEELPGEVARVTAALAAPVLRLFDGLDPDPDYVRNIAPGFRVLPIGTE